MYSRRILHRKYDILLTICVIIDHGLSILYQYRENEIISESVDSFWSNYTTRYIYDTSRITST